MEIREIRTKKPGLDVFDVTAGLDDQTKNLRSGVIPIYITSSDNCQVGLDISWYKISIKSMDGYIEFTFGLFKSMVHVENIFHTLSILNPQNWLF